MSQNKYLLIFINLTSPQSTSVSTAETTTKTMLEA